MTFFIICDGLVPQRVTRNMTYHDEYLKAHKEVSTAIIAFNLNITERFVIQRQRKLGLRKLTGNKRKGERHDD